MADLQHDGLPVVPPNTLQDCPRTERRFHRQTALLHESVRRQTFANWKVSFVRGDELAEAGFFYLRTLDHVQCAFCQGIVGYWDPGDEPRTEHKKHFPNCPFIAGVATGNVPLNKSQDDLGQLFTFLDSYYAFRVANTRPQTATTAYQTDAQRIETGQVAYPQFNTYGSRLSTFTRWPKEVGLSEARLAEAGWFYTGLADWLQCFHCGGGLHTWRQGDDPWLDHARFYPFCPFVRMQRGEDAVKQCWVDAPAPVVAHRPVSLTPDEENLLLLHPIAQRAVQMGLSSSSMKGALRLRLENCGVLCRTVTEAMELVFDYEEDQRRKASSCHDGLAKKDEPKPNNLAATVPSEVNIAFFTNPPAPLSLTAEQETRLRTLRQEVEQLQREVSAEERRLLCRLCGQHKVAVVFQPCSHLHLCTDCAKPRDTCYTCGAVVRGTLRPILG